MQSRCLELIQKFQTEFRLEERFSAGKRHSAAGLLIKNSILKRQCNHLFRRDSFSVDSERSSETCRFTASANRAAIPVEAMLLPRHPMRAGATDCRALSAPDAFMCIICQFRLRRNTLRIMAPETSERTAFQKKSGADAGTVVYCEPLGFQNDSCQIFHGDSCRSGVIPQCCGHVRCRRPALFLPVR